MKQKHKPGSFLYYWNMTEQELKDERDKTNKYDRAHRGFEEEMNDAGWVFAIAFLVLLVFWWFGPKL